MSRNQKPDLPADELAFYGVLDEAIRTIGFVTIFFRSLKQTLQMASVAPKVERESGYMGIMQEYKQMTTLISVIRDYTTFRSV